MDILVRIETLFDDPSKAVVDGYVALLNTILEVAGASRVVEVVLLGNLERKYTKAGANRLTDLLPTIGKVQSVEFVPTAAAAGENKTI